jgi:cardiolipin synthase
MITSLPNLLTLSRILVIPPIVALFFFDSPFWQWVALGLYAAACLTDFFDGYVARSMGQISRFGRFLDPVADKLLVASVIFMLVVTDRLTGIAVLPGLVILIREILVSGLREHLASVDIGVPVSRLAKWKTTIQMFALGFLIVHDAAPVWIPAVRIGEIGVWIAAILTMITGYDYLRAGISHLAESGNRAPAKPSARKEPPVKRAKPV